MTTLASVEQHAREGGDKGLNVRYMAFSEPRAGILGKLGLVKRLYATLPARLLVEDQAAENHPRLLAELIGHFVVENNGCAIELLLGPPPASPREDFRVRPVKAITPLTFTQYIQPAVRHGGWLHVEQPLAEDPVEAVESYGRLAELFRSNPSIMQRPVILVLGGMGSVVNRPGLFDRLHSYIQGMSDLGCSHLLRLTNPPTSAGMVLGLDEYRALCDLRFLSGSQPGGTKLPAPILGQGNETIRSLKVA